MLAIPPKQWRSCISDGIAIALFHLLQVFHQGTSQDLEHFQADIDAIK